MLGGGGLSALRDLSLTVRGGVGDGEGRKAFGEVLSAGKVPSLRTVCLDWNCDDSFASFCEGMGRGVCVHSPVLLDLCLSMIAEDPQRGLRGLADTIRAGKLSALQKLCLSDFDTPSPATGRALGEALTHAEASLNCLKELQIEDLLGHSPTRVISAVLEGLARGSGRLPALTSLKYPPASIGTLGSQSLAAVRRGGKVPSLKDVNLCMSGIGLVGMNSFASALSCPHISSLRVLDVKLGGVGGTGAAAEVGMFSVPLSSGHLRRLEKLCVQGLTIIEEVRALCAGLGSGKMTALRELAVYGGAPLGVESAKAFSETIVAEKLPRLRTLSVTSMLNAEGVGGLVDGWMIRQPPSLQHLSLRDNPLNSGAIEAVSNFLGSKRVPSLETVSLCSSGIDERSKSLLSKAFSEVLQFKF
uniref:Uncharacterized protein n=1 Tax=Chromera velia CCMP2878 TaxID=1169474 RepID=A0A0G4I804_9ALVE|eukprot:Cvel_11799.t1-p1 / transcript=Cvel_11799.t1 / gene=Cvel_11799 / organism=Chromera_velia_CCMP2878 / gene_product=hypothetical protein / transcript_product=hypothetical protein / location=Cvel_scaffold750:61999-63240(+) / protein_length=414 / sequence_SO=supercontig / SO=protein_coding / is_pseudo=false